MGSLLQLAGGDAAAGNLATSPPARAGRARSRRTETETAPPASAPGRWHAEPTGHGPEDGESADAVEGDGHEQDVLSQDANRSRPTWSPRGRTSTASASTGIHTSWSPNGSRRTTRPSCGSAGWPAPDRASRRVPDRPPPPAPGSPGTAAATAPLRPASSVTAVALGIARGLPWLPGAAAWAAKKPEVPCAAAACTWGQPMPSRSLHTSAAAAAILPRPRPARTRPPAGSAWSPQMHRSAVHPARTNCWNSPAPPASERTSSAQTAMRRVPDPLAAGRRPGNQHQHDQWPERR